MKIFSYQECASTQDEAWKLYESGEPLPFCVSAVHQTAGKGRMGRKWDSEKEKSLCFSVVRNFSISELPGLTLVSALLLRESLSIPDLKIKWPNDLMLGSNKVAGILTESKSMASSCVVVMGIGINCFHLHHQNFKGIQKWIELPHVLTNLESGWADFSTKTFKDYQKTFESLLWKIGEEVDFQTDAGLQRVYLRGIGELGQLLIDRDGQLELKSTGEIVFES